MSVRVSLLILSLVIASTIYRYVERPARLGKLRAISVCGMSTVLLPLLGIVIAIGFGHWRSSSRDFRDLLRPSIGFSQCSASQFDSPGCRNNEAPELIVWGDSFAMHLVTGLAKSSDLGIVQATRFGCAPIVGLAHTSAIHSQREGQACLEFNQSVMDYLAATPSIQVVLWSSPLNQFIAPNAAMLLSADNGYQTKSVDFVAILESMRTTALQIRAMGKRVVFVSPPPIADFNVGLCQERLITGTPILGKHTDCRLNLAAVQRFQKSIWDVIRQIPSSATVPLIDLRAAMCSQGQCISQVNGNPVYRDAGHLSYFGSTQVAAIANLPHQVMKVAK